MERPVKITQSGSRIFGPDGGETLHVVNFEADRGSVCISRLPDDPFRAPLIWGLFVSPDSRGQGLASVLMYAATNFLCENHEPSFLIEWDEYTTPQWVLLWYERIGCMPFEKRQNVVRLLCSSRFARETLERECNKPTTPTTKTSTPMKLISTHNSATGERSRNLLHALATPFARCQRGSLYEQFRQGCTYFDIRCRKTRRHGWHCAHGLWLSRRSLESVLAELSLYAHDLSRRTGRHLYIAIGLERGGNDELEELKRLIHAAAYEFCVTYYDTKQGGWHIDETDVDVPLRCDFADLNLSLLSWRHPATWKVLLPIPRLWAMLRHRPTFDEETFTQVDFL